MTAKSLKITFYVNTFFFFILTSLFYFYSELDLYVSKYFYIEKEFLSERFTSIKDLRSCLKNLMIIIPSLALTYLIIIKLNIFDKNRRIKKLRFKIACLGLIIGPVVGSGIIANLIFKENWGRARPVHIQEFGGDKEFTPAFVKTNQCKTNCSWISGETSAAFSFLAGILVLKNRIFLTINIILGLLVFFCRISMGGHFLSDNLFSIIFMIYIAIFYSTFSVKILKRK